MRKLLIGAATGALFFAVVGVALALTNNTVDYSSTLIQKVKASKSRSVNVGYKGVLNVGTTDGKQPNTSHTTEVFFAKQLQQNARRFPSCKASDISGKTTVPRKCRAAVVGSGNATAMSGQPGGDSASREDLSVTAYNGNKGKQFLLALNSKPGAPVPISNAVIPGTIGGATGAYGYKITFKVPTGLQQVLGVQIALTHFDVSVGTKKTVKVRSGGRKQAVSYIQLKKKGCPASKLLPTKAVVHFNDDQGNPGGQDITSEGTMTCR